MAPHDEKIAVVTGASRGVGRGIAVALGSQGCTVYVTGRSEREGAYHVPGTIHETAAAVTAAGGKGIAVRVDHSDDDQVRQLFERIEAEEGRLDILVNNAFATHDELISTKGFWEKPLAVGDVLTVGLRSGYVASYYAAPLMVSRKSGLIVFTSAPGSVVYAFGPAYGAHKAGVDKFAADMALELEPHGVAALSLWVGPALTERVAQVIAADPDKFPDLAEQAETPEFTGDVIWALFKDPELQKLSGRTLIGAEAALRYGITDRNGRQARSWRDMLGVSPRQQPRDKLGSVIGGRPGA